MEEYGGGRGYCLSRVVLRLLKCSSSLSTCTATHKLFSRAGTWSRAWEAISSVASPGQALRAAHLPLPSLYQRLSCSFPHIPSPECFLCWLVVITSFMHLPTSSSLFPFPRVKNKPKGQTKPVPFCSLFLLGSSIHFCSAPFSKPDTGERNLSPEPWIKFLSVPCVLANARLAPSFLMSIR